MARKLMSQLNLDNHRVSDEQPQRLIYWGTKQHITPLLNDYVVWIILCYGCNQHEDDREIHDGVTLEGVNNTVHVISTAI
ncbi:hypothetical protein J6590_085756 [Homalodisca vitripennis]|nr:hypothetical protein J6590_085756 [Homalodisca vitripennis]